MSVESILAALGLIIQPQVLLIIGVSAAFGLFVGAIPGLTATMATALLVPVTFFMDPVSAVAAIVTTTAMAVSAGDIPGALLRIPGTPASAAYTDEAFAMTRKGLADQALGASLTCAAIGGLFGSIVLVVAAPILAEIALDFSAFEFFWLAALGLSTAALVSTSDRVKGILSLLIGLSISMVGLDVMSGHPRFNFGVVELMGGISFIPAMIGMFALSEMLREVSVGNTGRPKIQVNIGNPYRGLGTNLRRYKLSILRGGSLGTGVGALPGVGGDIAAWIAYAVSRRFSKTPDQFGKGHVEGIIEAGSANNSGLSSAWIPALVFGVPGDAITAIAVGVLFMKGLNPGPRLFSEQPEMLMAVILTFFVANLMLFPLGYLAISLCRHILSVPRRIVVPVVLVFCVVGSFAINNSVFGIGVMLVLGVFAYLLESNGFPIAPIILGIVLGPILEKNFMMAMMIADGHLAAFFARPIAAVLGVVTLGVWLAPVLIRLWAKLPTRKVKR